MLAFGPNRGRNVTFVHPHAWLGGVAAVDPRGGVCESCFAASSARYGPATHQDFRTWWGGGTPAAPAGSSCAGLGDEVVEVEAEGRQAWVLAGRPRARSARSNGPQSIHLLPVFDLYTLHYRPREAFLPPGVYDRIYRTAGWISPVVLVDGAVAGVWEYKKRARRLDVRVELFVRETKRLRAGIARRAKSLGEFLELPVELLD